MDKKLEKLQEIIGYQFQRPGLLAHALTHSSYANERHWDKTRCNERLEFLGDARCWSWFPAIFFITNFRICRRER